MRIGIYGGAFDPIHNGHISMVTSAKDFFCLDKVLVVPSYISPHKDNTNNADCYDRYNMALMAVEDVQGVDVSDIEIQRQGKSYTIDTVLQLRKIYPQDELFLIVGGDMFLSFNKWYMFEEILKNVTLCGAARREDEYVQLKEFKNELEKYGDIRLFIKDIIELSSTQIREMIKTKADCNNYLPKKVVDYIVQKGLYI